MMVFPNYPGTVLKNGSKGSDVQLMQASMNTIFGKYPLYDLLNDDGIFGDATEGAVKEIQSTVNINANGVIGQKTWDSILAIANLITMV